MVFREKLFLHFPQANIALSFPQQLCDMLCSWLGPRQLVARDKEKKQISKRKSGNDNILIFACYLLMCSLLFSLVVRNELKTTNPREGTGPSPTRNIYLPNLNETHRRRLASRRTGRPVDSD